MISVNISHLNYWNQDKDPIPELGFIPAMQRRRLSKVAKIALHVAYNSLNASDNSVDFIVWSSRYGEEHKTLGIISDISNDSDPSPTSFSTSVHNAIAGLYSILFKDDTPSVSISADKNSLNQAMIDAYSYLKIGLGKKVLIVCYDDTLPELYNEPSENNVYALSFIVEIQEEHNLDLVITDNYVNSDIPEAIQFIKFWYSNEQVLHNGYYQWHKK